MAILKKMKGGILNMLHSNWPIFDIWFGMAACVTLLSDPPAILFISPDLNRNHVLDPYQTAKYIFAVLVFSTLCRFLRCYLFRINAFSFKNGTDNKIFDYCLLDGEGSRDEVKLDMDMISVASDQKTDSGNPCSPIDLQVMV